jgi:protein-tyrosine phosphatase
LIDESLEFYGVKTTDEASDIVRRARARSGLTEEQAMELANEQVRQSRNA